MASHKQFPDLGNFTASQTTSLGSRIWCERGSPTIERTPAHTGFSSTLVQHSVGGQLSGKITHH